MVNNTITLNFEIEKGKPINQYYFSARIKLTDESKNLLREKLGNAVEFDNLDSPLDLNPENFYIYYNQYAYRDELYVRDDNSRYLASNLPLNHYGFSMELSANGASIADYGFYPLYAIYNPSHYNKTKEKVFDDHGKLLPVASNMLDNFLSNKNNLSTQDVLQNVFLHLQKEAAEEIERLEKEREEERQREEELNQKNEELKELIEKDEIKIFKVIKGHDIGDGRSAAVLRLDQREGNEITLDTSKYYIGKDEDGEYLASHLDHVDIYYYDNLFFVLNQSSHSGFESGFYSADSTDPHNYAKYSKEPYLKGDQLSEKLSNELKEGNNQVGAKFTINNEQRDEEAVLENETKPRIKRAAEENDNGETVSNSVNTYTKSEGEKITAVGPQENSVSQELVQKLFPNTESVIINDELTIEVKYGGLVSYTPDYIKQTVKDAYVAWSNNFYSQKGSNTGPVKLQLYVLKNYDDYKAHIKELSGGKDHNELWGGGTVRAHEADGTIAKTFIFGDVNGLLCAKSKILMEKMSDAFLEYYTGNFNEVPEVLRTGMKLFMWSYDAAKKESTRDMHYTKEAYDKMLESGHTTPYKIASMSNDYRMADCLVTFLQEEHPQLIKQLLAEISFNGVQAMSKFKYLLNNPEIEKEFKQWMDVKSGNKIAEDLVPDSEIITFNEHKLQVNIKYDNEELNQNRLSNIKDTIEDAIKDFDSAFGINNSQPWHNIPNKVNIFVFNTRSDYENYLKELSIGYQGNSGLTLQGRGSDIHVYFYLQDQFNNSCKTLKHELGHALIIINSYYGTGSVLPKAMHEGIANYVASLEDGQHVNDHGDKEALIAIRNKDLKPDEILRNNIISNKGEHYHSDAEQVIKFLEDKHPDMIDNLLKNLSTSGTNRSQGEELVERFLAKLKGYDQEFKQWVKVQLSGEEYLKREHKVSSTQEDKTEHPTNEERKRSKRSLEEDKDEQEEVVITSVIDSMKDDKEEDDPKHPLKVKIGEPIETGKYKVELQVTYDDVKNFYDIVRNKYHESKEYTYEQVMVLYNEIVRPANNHYYESFTLDKAYVAGDHLFIKGQDFGTLDDFNEMFYKSDELV
ncbi:hypothetical protein [Wolbachia endosymbiont of Ctenocephalides felis wCfeJ]|uniref:hypothetical protein n=1 Tax=Wolbachia endosymbiont of Ctenocephalides felis wCfeJ TaxID=2732594 RepID=UPI001FEA2BD5|nr:hypothetical protein [Wolbachia endosymbiont of Ctenocephalides felis wCfeJ]WCR57881.1 MAG: hypothetical protein PG980_000353 [Wolbachia endosymbiont of Ctenocephalides felis wCfeJ]